MNKGAIMAKKKPALNPEHYQYLRAIVDGHSLHWEYRLNGRPVGAQGHDEPVEGWTDDDIIRLTRATLCVEADDPVKIEVQHS